MCVNYLAIGTAKVLSIIKLLRAAIAESKGKKNDRVR